MGKGSTATLKAELHSSKTIPIVAQCWRLNCVWLPTSCGVWPLARRAETLSHLPRGPAPCLAQKISTLIGTNGAACSMSEQNGYERAHNKSKNLNHGNSICMAADTPWWQDWNVMLSPTYPHRKALYGCWRRVPAKALGFILKIFYNGYELWYSFKMRQKAINLISRRRFKTEQRHYNL